MLPKTFKMHNLPLSPFFREGYTNFGICCGFIYRFVPRSAKSVIFYFSENEFPGSTQISGEGYRLKAVEGKKEKEDRLILPDTHKFLLLPHEEWTRHIKFEDANK